MIPLILCPLVLLTMLFTANEPLVVLATALAGWSLGVAMVLHSDRRHRA